MSIDPMLSKPRRAPRRFLTCLLAVTAMAPAVGLAAAGPAAANDDPSGTTTYAQGSSPALAVKGGVRYAVPKNVCPAATKGRATCMAVQLVPATKGTAGAKAITSPGFVAGPHGGLTPATLASAYGYSRTVGGADQTVAIVDAYDNPYALQDLNTFNSQYGFPAETVDSFVKVNQDGQPSPLPAFNIGWASEISLDIQAVRAVCALCKILLVEADSSFSYDLGAAVNTAAELGATEISNSYGGAENPGDSNKAAYTHPGVVITASTGDDGWYGWDAVNGGVSSDSVASTPAAYPDVVAVGGTALSLNSNGTRHTETVWNENGLDDRYGPGGASGGGCSTNYAAHSWQVQAAGYAATGCGTMRMAGDIAAVGDPNTGFDVYDTYHAHQWVTFGGTSLSSPLIAAMWALAGGSGGIDYPARSLYYNLHNHAASAYDVTVGGNSYCGGDTQAHCAAALKTDTGGINPNKLFFNDTGQWAGLMDCGFRYDGAAGPKPNNKQCNATTGYDGPSGVGTPKGLSLFTPLPPTVAIQAPALKLNVAQTFKAMSFSDPYPGATAASYDWNWGDGTTHATTASASHKYTVKGTHVVTLTVTDSQAHIAKATSTVTVGVAPVARITGSTSWHVNATAKWSSAASTDPNTGGKIVTRHWKFGTKVYGTSTTFSHKFTTLGKRTLTLVLVDNTGLITSKSITVNVTR